MNNDLNISDANLNAVLAEARKTYDAVSQGTHWMDADGERVDIDGLDQGSAFGLFAHLMTVAGPTADNYRFGVASWLAEQRDRMPAPAFAALEAHVDAECAASEANPEKWIAQTPLMKNLADVVGFGAVIA
jgi:hypothetical protein